MFYQFLSEFNSSPMIKLNAAEPFVLRTPSLLALKRRAKGTSCVTESVHLKASLAKERKRAVQHPISCEDTEIYTIVLSLDKEKKVLPSDPDQGPHRHSQGE